MLNIANIKVNGAGATNAIASTRPCVTTTPNATQRIVASIPQKIEKAVVTLIFAS